MGFYMPAVLVKDAQRHGLRVKPIDIQVSDWPCEVERESDNSLSLRLGLGYAKGLRQQSAEAIVASRMNDGLFSSIEDLSLRVPLLNKKELAVLARIGALNKLGGVQHRRDALWQVKRAGKLEGPLFRQKSELLRDEAEAFPLLQMTTEERLVADYSGTGLTVGRHPMHSRRAELREQGMLMSHELKEHKDGEYVRTAGCVIARQRPGTAKGYFIVQSLQKLESPQKAPNNL
jgi:error-prone DNA polymerase